MATKDELRLGKVADWNDWNSKPGLLKFTMGGPKIYYRGAQFYYRNLRIYYKNVKLCRFYLDRPSNLPSAGPPKITITGPKFTIERARIYYRRLSFYYEGEQYLL